MPRYEETGDESQKPQRSVAEGFEKGELGRKTGNGWYEYDQTGPEEGLPVIGRTVAKAGVPLAGGDTPTPKCATHVGDFRKESWQLRQKNSKR